jgi:hypothetical protein
MDISKCYLLHKHIILKTINFLTMIMHLTQKVVKGKLICMRLDSPLVLIGVLGVLLIAFWIFLGHYVVEWMK